MIIVGWIEDMVSNREHRAFFDGKESVQKFSRTTKTLIKTLAGILGVSFTVLNFREVSLVPFSDEDGASVILKCAIFLYYLAWLGGTLSDVSDEEIVYLKAPCPGRIPWHAIVMAMVLTGGFALLCVVRSVEEFVIAISLFWIIQHLLWIYLVRYIECPTYIESKKIYEDTRTWDRLELLEITYDQIAGRWIKFRFLFGAFALTYINVITFTGVGETITKRLDFANRNFTVALTVLAFLCVSEIWIWMMRVRTKMANYLYRRLVSKYKLSRKSKGRALGPTSQPPN